MTKTKNPPKVRLNLTISPSTRERLDGLQARTDADTLTEVIRRALAVYDTLIQAEARGGHLMIAEPGQPDARLELNPS